MQRQREQVRFLYTENGMALQTVLHPITFLKTYKFLKKSQWWSKEKLDVYQLQQLSKLIHHAYEHVPYYKKVFEKLDLKPNDIQSIQDLQKLPFLTKKIINKHIEDLKAINYPKHRFEYTYTGGSTGEPLKFYTEKGVWLSTLMAYSQIQMGWFGCSYLDKSVFITGRDNPWKYQLLGRMLVLSSFYMNESYIPQFIEKIRKLKPKYITTYPSAITILAKYMKKNDIEIFPSIETIICHAETLYSWQRNLLEEIFQCRVHDTYGLREQTNIGGTCKHSNYYHMFPEYGVLELVDKDGKPITNEGEIGEIVGTGFHTYFFPFIRYKTGDLGVYTNKRCKCGRNYPLLIRIEGRIQDFVISKTKKLVPFTRFQHLAVESSDNVEECQFYQDTEGKLILNIVKSQNYTDTDTLTIQKNFKKILGNEFDLVIHFIDEIPLSNRGKLQFLIQKLPIKFGPNLNSQL